ncbi:uncharacterized protein [Centruroides vittatus]|uniref:uncharacterized protein n=1 Tax=Centruroides vittatus TaxID=120091 RepID=UPI00350FF9B6
MELLIKSQLLLIFFVFIEGKPANVPVCSDPNEEYRLTGCEKQCSENIPEHCNGPRCFCNWDFARKGKKCVALKDCVRQFCTDPNAKFNSASGGGRLCLSYGGIVYFDSFVPIPSCDCKPGYLHNCSLYNKCITEKECKNRMENPMKCF